MSKIYLIFTLVFYPSILFAGDYIQISAQSFKYDNQAYLALNFSNQKKWHTYWKNPGDAGLPIKIKFYIDNKKVKLGELPWPAPTRFIEQGELWAYGFEGDYSLFYRLDERFISKNMRIEINALICKEICVPDISKFVVAFDNHLNSSFGDKLERRILIQRINDLPRLDLKPKINIMLTKTDDENKLALHYFLEDIEIDQIPQGSNIITPYLFDNFDYKHEQAYYDINTKTLIGRFLIDWDGIYKEPPLELSKDGKFPSEIQPKFLLHYPKSEPAKIIKKSFKEFTLYGDKSLLKTFRTLTPVEDLFKSKKEDKTSLLLYLLFAFLGGLILNIMPCVLPVISLKLFSIISHKNESKRRVFLHNMTYTLGVLFSFCILALSIILIQASGSIIGWGFQLSSPLFVYILLVLIFIFSLNLFGLFEFRTPGGKYFGGLSFQNRYFNDFFNGVLATILSTPCSAPFLGTALGFAFTTTPLITFLIFIMIGIGLSFPFILTGIFPGLVRFLPSPGNWMNKAKIFLGLSLLATAIWLFDVFISLVGSPKTWIYLIIILGTILVAFIIKKTAIRIGLLTLSLGLSVFLFNHKSFVGPSAGQILNSHWEAWSPSLMSKLQKGKKLTFVDFTATWCLTCKVNKKLVLDTDDFISFAQKNSITLVRGDWTAQDPKITQFLNEHKIAGVPAYFIINKNGKIIFVGETLTLGKIKKSFNLQ